MGMVLLDQEEYRELQSMRDRLVSVESVLVQLVEETGHDIDQLLEKALSQSDQDSQDESVDEEVIK